ncbi:MAG: hypothetical protein B7Y36_17145 [Novosphingobium sp. 28-62-57]|uniref:hypothetical protein n=1 Tax=unclassified Novosphingobium TaxID=2644732 RepID=UPI000BC5A391|nr:MULTISPECIES: hypothetical protein [unclassified Novosphingobium]OYW47663.1 MAG: hypothetical protein B7Z36_02570 [Novosphingobium sp. 12-63-9]OYZ08407.1 MAG: hypothetical protein B7Y36_17145 [Novosphingobium sp. 28-62-57]OZA35121.1 MAG: hypothetical protein B7X92_09885 [Novosphingobium sp. 17-62-9]HQS69296.1 hypothetical protein [Novosphingobium sp.]
MSAPMVPIDLARVAEVLDMLGEEVEALGRQLCTDPALVATFMNELQAIDRIAQHQHALASLLRADCMTSAVNSLGLEELAQRLRAHC